MIKTIRSFVWILAISLPSGVSANTATVSYHDLLEQESESAGDIVFDLRFGAAALAAGEPGAAVFAFQRVLAQQPDNPEAHLGIARAYFDMGEDNSSRRHFDMLYAVADADTQSFIQTYLTALDDRSGQRRPSTVAYAGIDVGYDDNLTQVRDGQPAGILDIFQIQSSAYTNLEAGIAHQQPLGAVWHWQVAGVLDTEIYHQFDDADKQRYQLNGGIGGRINAWRWNVDLSNGEIRRDNEKLYSTLALAAVLEHREEGFWKKAGLRLLQRDYDLEFLDRDVHGYELILGARHAGRTVRWSDVGVDLYIGDEAAKSDSADDFGRSYLTARFRWFVLPHPRVRIATGYDFSRSDFKDPGVQREDDFHSLLIKASVANVLREDLELNAQISRDENHSSDQFLTYDRNRISVGLRYNWGI